MNYEMIVSKNHPISEEYVNKNIIPNLVAVNSLKNNEIVYRTFGITDKTTYLEKKTAEQFEKLKNYAKLKNIILDITSGYLSFAQQQLKYDYFVKIQGLEFAQKSACLPGCSEHNTGLALDCDIFKNGRWAGIALGKDGNINKETALLHTFLYKFGFILRYPKGKESITQMKFEPWHIRYVGEPLAKHLYESNITLEEYYETKKR